MIKRKITVKRISNPESKIRNRFYVQESNDGGYDLVDDKWGMIVNFENKFQANESAKLARDYVKKWGDIDFSCFPYDLNTELKYPDKEFFIVLNSVKWEAFELPRNKSKVKKNQIIYTIVDKDNVWYVFVKNLENNEKIVIPLNVKNGELSHKYKSALIRSAEKLGMDDYPNFNTAYSFFIKNKDKIITLRDSEIFSEIQSEYERLYKS